MNTKKSFIAFGIAALSLGVLLSSQLFTSSKDPLRELLGSSFLQADFFTESVSSYTGPISESLQDCINKTPVSQTQTVYASYNPLFTTSLSRDKILSQIAPVLGHAVKNSQINWRFDISSKEYLFTTAKGDEAMWACYFKNETPFFSNFFIPQSIVLDKDTPNLQIVFSEDSNAPSSSEILRIKKYVSTPEIERNGVFMGTLHFSSLLNLEKLTHSLFTSSSPVISLPLEHDVQNSTSTMEILRNPTHPFLSVKILSTSEATRKEAANAARILQLDVHSNFGGVSDYYALKILGDKIPIDSLFQVEINKNIISPFLYEGKNISVLFPLGFSSLQTLVVQGNTSNICPAIYDPVCGQPPMPSCNGSACPQMMPMPKTYANSCEFTKANAIFISKGECLSQTPCPMPDLPFPPDGCAYYPKGEDTTSFPGCTIPLYTLVCS